MNNRKQMITQMKLAKSKTSIFFGKFGVNECRILIYFKKYKFKHRHPICLSLKVRESRVMGQILFVLIQLSNVCMISWLIELNQFAHFVRILDLFVRVFFFLGQLGLAYLCFVNPRFVRILLKVLGLLSPFWHNCNSCFIGPFCYLLWF